jgi:hypothetical protein
VSRSYDYGGLGTDGYLTFSGDEDNPAFIGDGPFHQAIGGTFDLNSSQTRFPCSLTVSFWRTVAPINATTNLALTSNTVTFTCVTGQFEISPEGVVLNPGESYTFSPAVPQVALLSGDPRSAAGTFGGFARCDNTQVSVQARIDWSSKERMHVLYGIVRECYEPFNPCGTICNGAPAPEIAYVTISNYTGPAKDSPFVVEGTYVLERIPNTCEAYSGDTPNEAGCQFHIFDTYMRLAKIDGVFKFFWRVSTKLSTNPGVCDELWLGFVATAESLCEPDLNGEVESGSGGSVALGNHYVGGLRYVFPDATFDWKIEV